MRSTKARSLAAVRRWPESRADLPARENSGPMDTRHPAPRVHTEAAEHRHAAAGAIEGVRPEVEAEAVAAPAARPSAHLLGGLEHGHRAPGPGDLGGGGEPGEPGADHDGGKFIHTIQTIEPARM